ncbi:hypothetical protein FRC14_006428 [Serendipita sp. 396]|nr:hypothetical protein FRC14_006428 [Serendipita sp. 396]KAG8779072.1 hypothetical protein FRC15_010387 [Serendipita sp. 397]KAG8795526.1 hypothetical protein FRC16_010047 [Serendipita sp. 398]KAG8812451.1 hypothetical protein FRC19_003120 [Serendipita sp. 401]KAG8868185.1 hypothetical protein FRC20_003970 [Serendipita sp. 405]KAG9042633.1 hypothetical protein FS842_002119 [Serendipita sp. 407]
MSELFTSSASMHVAPTATTPERPKETHISELRNKKTEPKVLDLAIGNGSGPFLAPEELGKAVLDALQMEYNTLRTESLGAINNRLFISSFSLGAFGLILAGLMTRQSPDVPAGIIAMICIPPFAKVCCFMWLGEYKRSQRAGRAVAALEQHINKLLGCSPHSGPANWETRLYGEGAHQVSPYVASMLTLLGAGWSGFFLGLWLVTPAVLRVAPGWRGVTVLIAVACTMVIMEILWCLKIRLNWKTIREAEMMPKRIDYV